MSEAQQHGYLVGLADAMAAALNAAQDVASGEDSPFVVAFAAERAHEPLVDLRVEVKASDPPIVQIIPNADSSQRIGGGTDPLIDGTLTVSVFLYGRVGARTTETKATFEAACAQLSLLREQIRNWFWDKAVSLVGPVRTRAILSSVEGEPAYEHATLIQEHVFASEQMLTFKAVQ